MHAMSAQAGKEWFQQHICIKVLNLRLFSQSIALFFYAYINTIPTPWLVTSTKSCGILLINEYHTLEIRWWHLIIF